MSDMKIKMEIREYRWASELAVHSMPHPDELRYFGYTEVRRNGEIVRGHNYPSSILMVRDVE